MAHREREPNVLLRRARERLGLSQERVAELVNTEVHRVTGRAGALTAKAISDWECGWYTWPAQPSRNALCRVFGVADPADLGFRRRWPTRSAPAVGGPPARRYIDRAWTAAVAAERPELQAVVLGVRSFQAAHAAGDHRIGLELAEQACEIAAAGPSTETRGWVCAVASERCASLGDLAGTQRHLDRSRVALGASSTETRALGIGEFTVDKLAAYEGGDLVRMGRYHEAEPALDLAIDSLGPYMHRHRCTALIDRAEARFGAGEIDGACEDGRSALDLTAQVQHAANFRRIYALATRACDAGLSAGHDLWNNVTAITARTLRRPSTSRGPSL